MSKPNPEEQLLLKRSRKRDSAGDQESNAKRPRIASDVSEQRFPLLDLSEELLMIISKNLQKPIGDLIRLSETCKKLSRLCSDRSLWIKVDTRGGGN